VSRALPLAAAGVFLVLAVTACSGPSAPADRPNASATAALNGLSAMDVVAAINSAGLPTPNTHDVTSDKCVKLQCVNDIDSDTVSVLTFDGSGPAQLYAGAISNSYELKNVVLVLASTVTVSQKVAYERVVERVIA
jgi:hypothetical protein